MLCVMLNIIFLYLIFSMGFALFGFVHQDLEAVLFLAVKCNVIRIIAG